RIMGGLVMSAEQLQKLRNDLQRFYKDAVRERLRCELDVVRWRLQLLRTKGIVIVDGEAFTWAGEARLPRWLREIASKLTLQCDDTANALNAGDTASASALITALEALSLFVWVNDDLVNVRNHATAWELLRDRQRASQCASATRAIERALQRAGEHIRMGRWSDALSLLRTARQRLLSLRGRGGKVLQAPIVNELNYGLENKFGWFDFTGFLDNNPTNWGLELAPRQVTSRIELNGIWQFRTDPQNVGMKRNWHKGAFGKAERTLKVPGSWESQGVTQVNPLHIKQHPFPSINVGADVPYNGWAWYWRFVHIPKEWAGHDLELIVHGIDDFDWTYWNGELIGHTGAKVPNFWRTTRRYRIPKRIVRFGDSNLLIVRIYDCRGYGGIIGDAELQCIGWQARHSTPAVATPDVLVSPLSIAVWVELNGDTLWLSGWRKMGEQLPQELLCIIGDKVRRLPLRNVAYDMQRDGRLSECWLALITKGAPSKSLLIVLECNPTRIVADDATIRITFNRRHASVLLLRPFHDGKVNAERCRLWARIAIAYPIAFTEVPFKVGAKLRIITCYNYRILRN
ncbi:MAG TPA: hypothetical protein EYP10_13175, partial [Armatimonadetes bacterium]|nr:hypothetical protein [Armatimonadota bacterium]